MIGFIFDYAPLLTEIVRKITQSLQTKPTINAAFNNLLIFDQLVCLILHLILTTINEKDF
jgi:hypothetical protein